MNGNENLIGAIEAVLFTYGEAITFDKLSKLLEKDIETIKNAIEELKNKLSRENSGLTIIFMKDKIQLTTKPEFSSFIQKILKQEIKEELSPVALETLSIIAYSQSQGISRAMIEYLRGVNSSYILRNLLIRGLIEKSTDPQRKNVYLYSLSPSFLKHSGLKNIKELPNYQKYNELIKNCAKQ